MIDRSFLDNSKDFLNISALNMAPRGEENGRDGYNRSLTSTGFLDRMKNFFTLEEKNRGGLITKTKSLQSEKFLLNESAIFTRIGQKEEEPLETLLNIDEARRHALENQNKNKFTLEGEPIEESLNILSPILTVYGGKSSVSSPLNIPSHSNYFFNGFSNKKPVRQVKIYPSEALFNSSYNFELPSVYLYEGYSIHRLSLKGERVSSRLKNTFTVKKIKEIQKLGQIHCVLRKFYLFTQVLSQEHSIIKSSYSLCDLHKIAIDKSANSEGELCITFVFMIERRNVTMEKEKSYFMPERQLKDLLKLEENLVELRNKFTENG